MSLTSKDKANAGRVRITYDIETGGNKAQRELPFVIGVIGDFAGEKTLPSLAAEPSKRRFVDITEKSFDTVMGEIAPFVTLTVPDMLSAPRDANGEAQPGDQQLPPLTLTFRKMEDFSPERIVDQVPGLAELRQTRVRLRELLTKASRSEDLAQILKEVLEDPSKLDALAQALKSPGAPEPTP
ncbi:MAG: hypothetical protein RLZZ501_1176 [Pseudomonadota bacterium]|jgi:type VI secretion system protein ImpB